MNFEEITKDVLRLEANELLQACEYIDDSISKAVELIYESRGKFIVTGVGKSGLVGNKIAATLASTGTSSFFLHPTEALHGDLGMIGKDDVVLAISYSGESEELTRILPHIKRFDIPLVAMTRDKTSTLAKYADVTILTKIETEACPLNIAPTSSTTLTMALGDALAICLMKKREFKKEDFASYHPGGSLGKQLFIKVEDLMQKTKIPTVDIGTKLKDALKVMNEGKVGNLIVLDKNKKVHSILSDGDLRRALQNESFSTDVNVEEYATKNPKLIENENMLASEALSFLEEHKIQLLVVVKDNNVVGILHIHDLIEAGIK